MKTNLSVYIVVMAMIAIACPKSGWALPESAQGTTNSCSTCHGASQPGYMAMVDYDSLLNIGTQLDGRVRGALKTFTAVPGSVVRLSMEVLNGSSPYAVQLKRLEKSGQKVSVANFIGWSNSNDVGNAWDKWDASNPAYFTTRIFSGGETGTNYFDLYISPTTPSDVYDLEFSIAGDNGANLFYQDSHFYLEVLPLLDSINTYVGMTVNGSVSQPMTVEYAIPSSPNTWIFLTNFTLPYSPYIFVDTSVPDAPRLYRVTSP